MISAATIYLIILIQFETSTKIDKINQITGGNETFTILDGNLLV